MRHLVVFLFFLLPGLTFAQSDQGTQIKLMSVQRLELDDLQLQVADRIEAQYQQRLKEAIKIIPVDRKEAYLKIALAILNANNQYLSILNAKQRIIWEEILSSQTEMNHQIQLQLNSERRSRTIALAVR